MVFIISFLFFTEHYPVCEMWLPVRPHCAKIMQNLKCVHCLYDANWREPSRFSNLKQVDDAVSVWMCPISEIYMNQRCYHHLYMVSTYIHICITFFQQKKKHNDVNEMENAIATVLRILVDSTSTGMVDDAWLDHIPQHWLHRHFKWFYDFLCQLFL